MLKKVLFALLVALGGYLLVAFAPQPTLARAVELPSALAALIAGGVFFLVELLLSRLNVPDEAVQRIAAVITAGLLEILAVALGLIPPQFEEIARALLNLLVVILGLVSAAKLIFAGGQFAVRAFRAR